MSLASILDITPWSLQMADNFDISCNSFKFPMKLCWSSAEKSSFWYKKTPLTLKGLNCLFTKQLKHSPATKKKVRGRIFFWLYLVKNKSIADFKSQQITHKIQESKKKTTRNLRIVKFMKRISVNEHFLQIQILHYATWRIFIASEDNLGWTYFRAYCMYFLNSWEGRASNSSPRLIFSWFFNEFSLSHIWSTPPGFLSRSTVTGVFNTEAFNDLLLVVVLIGLCIDIYREININIYHVAYLSPWIDSDRVLP